MSYERTAKRPAIGTLWAWEPEESPALIRVAAVHWNGEEWWVQAEVLVGAYPLVPHSRYWNDLSRFLEACHYVAGHPGSVGVRGAMRHGEPHPGEMVRAA